MCQLLIVVLSTVAGPPDDYSLVNRRLIFSPNQKSVCTTITIVDDLVVEQRESFFVTMERLPRLLNRILLDPDTAEIVIPNDDGEMVV